MDGGRTGDGRSMATTSSSINNELMISDAVSLLGPVITKRPRPMVRDLLSYRPLFSASISFSTT